MICLTVALPIPMHDVFKAFCEKVEDQEMRPIRMASIARLAIVQFLRKKGVTVPIPEADTYKNGVCGKKKRARAGVA